MQWGLLEFPAVKPRGHSLIPAVAPLPVLQQGHGQLTKQIKDCFNATTRVIGLGLSHTLKDNDDTLTFGSVSRAYQEG